jgi:hypothetical protein
MGTRSKLARQGQEICAGESGIMLINKISL